MTTNSKNIGIETDELDNICNICNEIEGYKCSICEFYLCGFCLHELNDKSICPQCRTKGRTMVDKDGDIRYDPYQKNGKPPTKGELAEKYFDLVWFVRRGPDDMPEESKKPYYEILKKYPNEIKKLDECDDNWQHGFNSGVLATLRLLDGGKIRYEDWEEFPMLDT